MNRHDDFIGRLAEGARHAVLPRDDMPPFGFTIRLLAGLDLEMRATVTGRLQWAALGAAALLCGAALVWNWSAPTPDDLELFAARIAVETLEP